MSVESDVQAAATAAPAAPAGNPVPLGLMTFLPSGITLGLWFIGYLPTGVYSGMFPIVTFSAGVFLLVSAIWAARVGASAVAAIFGVFSAFWTSFGFMVLALNNGWIKGAAADGVLTDAETASVLATYLLSFLIVFVILTLSTLRLPLAFTAGFVFVCATFALALAFVLSGLTTTIFSTLAGVCDFIFCAIFAYILWDGMSQELGGKAMPMGSPLTK